MEVEKEKEVEQEEEDIERDAKIYTGRTDEGALYVISGKSERDQTAFISVAMTIQYYAVCVKTPSINSAMTFVPMHAPDQIQIQCPLHTTSASPSLLTPTANNPPNSSFHP